MKTISSMADHAPRINSMTEAEKARDFRTRFELRAKSTQVFHRNASKINTLIKMIKGRKP